MKFIVSSSLLYKELQNLGGVINSSNTIPILDNFLFQVNKNKLQITSSDLESSMTSEIDIESESNESVAISAKLLLDILKTFADQPLTFNKSDKNTIEITADNGKYSLAYIDGSEFPKQIEIQDPLKTEINANDFLKAINSTIFASGNDDLRPVMSGVFFQFNKLIEQNRVPHISVFCWTEPYRLYHPELILSIGTEPLEGVDPNVYKTLDNYWKYLHSAEKDNMAYEYALKYYDQHILSKIKNIYLYNF